MEVFSKYFRRLLVGNAPQIFPGINKPVENPGNYPLLLSELRKISQDPDQARRIADSIDTSDGDLFKDFDLSTFMDHFKLGPIEKALLALAFTNTSRSDLSTKADAILSSNFRRLIETLSSATDSDSSTDIPVSLVAKLLEGLAQHPPHILNSDNQARLWHAIRMRYQSLPHGPPVEVSLAFQLLDLLGPHHVLARLLHRAGPQSTSNVQVCKELLQSSGESYPEEELVCGALLFMVATQNWRLYNPAVFVTALRELHQGQKIDWRRVVQGFDRDGLQVDDERFLQLYEALYPVAVDNPRLDLQLLWGGKWQHRDTQLSYLAAFTHEHPEKLNVTMIPQLRATFTVADFADAPEDVKEYASRAVSTPLVSSDAVIALFDLILHDSETLSAPACQRVFQDVVQSQADVFLCGAMTVPKPWTETQQDIVARLFFSFLLKQHPNYDFVLHYVWRRDKQWLANRLVETHAQDPMKLPVILDHAHKHRWLKELVMLLNGLGLDLAALAHRRGILDIGQWACTNAERGPEEFAIAICRFLGIKAEDESKTARKEPQRTISLAVKTVRAFSQIMEELFPEDRVEELAAVQRLTIQVYPRLINYGQGFDEIIDANDEQSKAFPDHVDEMMREHYKAMYGNERDVADIVEALRTYKSSRDPVTQDLFACMIHGLFDEYTCYQDYPMEALATTAVLFGGIIKFGLLSAVPLRVALGMVLEALRDYEPDSAMFRFGLQALLHFCNRLHEWPPYASCLLQIPGLAGTEAYPVAEEAASRITEQANGEEGADGLSDQNGVAEGAASTNGEVPDSHALRSALPPFTSIYVDPPERSDIYEEPSEDIQDSVLFSLNNLSEQNLELKVPDLTQSVQEKHHDWFAGYLVDERAKMQPNFHKLYLDMLTLFARKTLWEEVLRHTYVSAIRMLNSQSTLDSSMERSHLKNVAGWLGLLTLARDKPIKFRNISFRDLLVEAYDTQRLIIVIPFTCKVLAQASKSTVFKPPNPWLMEIIGLLIELYHFAELRLQLKFEIEVVCKDLGLDHRHIEPSFLLRERPRHDEELTGSTIPDGLESFDELALSGLGRSNARTQRYSPSTITASLPDIRSLLVYPPTSNTNINRDTLRYIVETAVRKAIQEIISPVVERSVGIAAISTAQLIHKDFAMEPNEDRVRQSAYTMVKALAGSLALVTCKEPLRMSMTNNIRVLSAEVEEQGLPEGAILMCVNDNLDAACSLVETAAEQRALPEIEENIEQQLAARRRHRVTRPAEPYIDPIINRWAFYIPEPYKQSPNGLNKEQMAIYEAFARQSRVSNTHEKASSTDSGRHIVGDMLQEQFPAVPNLSTPAEAPALPYDASQHQHPRVQPPPSVHSQLPENPRLNGFPQPKTIAEQIQELLFELQRAAKDAAVNHLGELPSGSLIVDVHHQIIRLVAMSPQRDQVALVMAKRIYDALYTQAEKLLEIEVLVQLLKELCDLVAITARELTLWLLKQEDEVILNAPVVVSLLSAGLLEVQRVDAVTARLLQQRNLAALAFLLEVTKQAVISDYPIAFRADFANSLDAVAQWAAQEPNLSLAEDLLQTLTEQRMPEVGSASVDKQPLLRRRQVEYAFSEWTRLCARHSTSERSYTAFISQLHQQRFMIDEEASCLFFRICIEMAVDGYEEAQDDTTGQLGDPYFQVDSLAKLVVLLLKFKDEDKDQAKSNQAAYLDSTLSLIVLVLNHHHVTRAEGFNQRVFFRFFSSVLCEYQLLHRQFQSVEKDIMLVLAKIFLALQPLHFPAFAFGWLSLISHRFFVPDVLLLPDQVGWEPYAKLIETMLFYIGELLKSLTIQRTTKELYRGVLRILLMLHHDFPEFLADNHFRLCRAIPAHCTQLRNLILSAYPSSFPELPDPFTAGLKVDRLNEIRTSPAIAGDFEEPLAQVGVKQMVDSALDGKQTEDHVAKVVEAITTPVRRETGVAFAPVNVDVNLVNALVLYIGTHALAAAGQKGGPTFSHDSPEAAFLVQLTHQLPAEARYYFISAIANQLRYPNSHTHYFSYALLFLFGSEPNEQPQAVVRQQITRVLLERLIVHRPHPWGLIITLLELLKNPRYAFWDLPFIKAAPEIERLFGALFQHINQSPR